MREVRSIPALSKETGVPMYTIRKLISDGRLPCLRMGNKIFIEVASFEKLFVTEGEEHEG